MNSYRMKMRKEQGWGVKNQTNKSTTTKKIVILFCLICKENVNILILSSQVQNKKR